MNLEAKTIEGIYSGSVAKKYDMSMGHFFARLKEKAFKKSSLKAGDQVLVFCCGTGLDFPHILRRIGEEGKITGVDFSGEMLNRAAKKISRNNWTNIELVHADSSCLRFFSLNDLTLENLSFNYFLNLFRYIN